jgi:multiple sugar transport system permease protein
MPVIVVSSILGVISLINSPTIVLLLTNGGPGDSTTVLPLLAFQIAFLSYDFGYSSAISVAVLAAIAGFAMVYIRFARFGKED